MSNPGSQDSGESSSFTPRAGDRLVYVVPSQALRDEQVDLLGVWQILWRSKILIAIITTVVAIGALVYVLTAAQWYRADVLLVHVDAKSTQGLSNQLDGLGGLGGLATLAGISIGGGDTAEPLAVLTSRDLTRGFIKDKNLLPVLFARDWDSKTKKWKDPDPAQWPDMQDAVKLFDEDIRKVHEDKKTKLVTLSIEWRDPQVAADWANELVRRLNQRMRARSLAEAESNIAYLKRELNQANVVTLQQAVGRLLESELQKAMLARVNEEFALRVIDSADPPKWRARPKRTQFMALAVGLGLFLGCLVALLRDTARRRASHGL